MIKDISVCCMVDGVPTNKFQRRQIISSTECDPITDFWRRAPRRWSWGQGAKPSEIKRFKPSNVQRRCIVSPFLVACKLLKYAFLESRACLQRDIDCFNSVCNFLYCTYRLVQSTTWSVKYAESDSVKIMSTNEYDYVLA